MNAALCTPIVIRSLSCNWRALRSLTLASLLVLTVTNTAASQRTAVVCVAVESLRALANARALDGTGRVLGISDYRGRLRVDDPDAIRRIERLGFTAVSLSGSRDAAVRSCIVLRRVELELPAVVVVDTRAPALGQSITRTTAQRAPAPAEADVFRILALAGGVTQSNDLRATVHLAGGATDETGVLLDGHPLQWPFHAASALSAFNVAALERVDVTIHHIRAARAACAGGNLIIAETDRALAFAARDTEYVLTRDRAANEARANPRIFVTAIDSNLTRILTDQKTRAAGVVGGYGLFGAKSTGQIPLLPPIM